MATLNFQEDYFVMLETKQPEQIVTAAEMLAKLEQVLADRADLSAELQALGPLSAQAQHLLDTSCELPLGPGEFLQWYAIRLEK